MDSKAMYKLSYGLFVLTAKVSEKENGCITNSAIQVASEPNQLFFAINKANYTHDMVMETKKCCLSVIGEYYGAVKSPVRRTGNRVSDESETDSELTRRSRLLLFLF